MDHLSLAPKFSNLLIISFSFSLVFFSQFFHLTFSLNDPPPTPVGNVQYISLHPDDKKVLFQIQQQLGNNTQSWTFDSQIDRCCIYACFHPQTMACNSDGRVSDIVLTFNSPASKSLIPAALGDLPFLRGLEITGPYFTGPITRAIRKLNLSILQIVNTGLAGGIPGTVFGMVNLTSLTISHNKFITGPIPKALSKLTNLILLDLSFNHLYDSIPSFIGRMNNLLYVYLNSNRFSGPLPVSLGDLNNVATLNLSQNQLTGSIPTSLGFINNQLSIKLLLNNNKLTGSIPRELARGSIFALDVSSNRLTNASELFQSSDSGILDMDLSNNRLKFDFSNARIPQYLRNLNISHNMIYGSLPQELGGERNWESIDVSYNQLCGQIPAGTALERFNPINFSHNACLCGAPLPPCTNK